MVREWVLKLVLSGASLFALMRFGGRFLAGGTPSGDVARNGASHVRIAGNRNRGEREVAVACGAGDSAGSFCAGAGGGVVHGIAAVNGFLIFKF